MSSLRPCLALHALVVAHLGGNLRVQATNSSLITTCIAMSPQSIGDGSCDSGNNNEDCEYDGGDCCPCTCEDGDYLCGVNGFDCQDPLGSDACSASSLTWAHLLMSAGINDTAYVLYPNCSSVGGFVPLIGDGFCDSDHTNNNNEECGYDGGDCCACTCINGSYPCGYDGYNCKDPTAMEECSDTTSTSTFDDYSTMYPDCGNVGGILVAIGTGYCTSANNNEECGYDGGDCCACTCFDRSNPCQCGINGYDCQDPNVPDDCSSTTSSSEMYPDCEGVRGNLLTIGNGCCTDANNNQECGYDGGDCCSSTCVSYSNLCGFNGYDCKDSSQSSSSANRSDIQCMDNVNLVGNGICDPENNNAYCDYDGGDCCSCTCVEADGSSCGDVWYDCHDPEANCDETSGTGGFRMVGAVAVGFVLVTVAAVFGLVLCLFFNIREGVINCIRGVHDTFERKRKAPHTQGAFDPARNVGAEMACIPTPSAPALPLGYVVQVGTIEEYKIGISEPTVTSLPQAPAV